MQGHARQRKVERAMGIEPKGKTYNSLQNPSVATVKDQRVWLSCERSPDPKLAAFLAATQDRHLNADTFVNTPFLHAAI
jgi:hypothetical protein